MIRILTSVLLFCGLAAAQVTPITVEGLGADKEAALQDALRKAVEQGVGMVLSSETVVQNYQIAKDVIFSKANGFVKTYSELETREEGGAVVVKIQAEVTAILDEVVKDQAALDFILSKMKQPKFMALLDESIRFMEDGKEVTSEAAGFAVAADNYGGAAAAVSGGSAKTTTAEKMEATHQEIASVKIGQLLSEKGFSFYDKKTLVEKYRDRMLKQGVKDGDVNLADLGTIEKMEKAAMMLAQSGFLSADYIITGSAVSTGPASSFAKNRFAGQATITAKVVRASDGKLMAQNTFHGKKSHANSRVAAEMALGLAAEDMAHYLMAETVKKWSLMQAGGMRIEISLSGVADVDYEASMKIEDHFKTDGNVSELEISSWDSELDEGAISLTYKGTQRDFEKLIMASSFETFVMKIKKKSGNTYTVQLTAK